MSKRHSRSAWGALPPVDPHTRVSDPAGITIHWNGPQVGNIKHASCAGRVRAIQRFHVEKNGWDDIAYSEVVCPHGDRYEGRGYHNKIGANGSNEGNATRYAILALVGDGDDIPTALLDGIEAACADYRENGDAGDIVDVHSDWFDTECPGDELRKLVKDGDLGAADGKPPAPSKPKPSTSSSSSGTWPTSWTLNRGDRGHRVELLQAGLAAVFPLYAKNVGTNGRPDGSFGPRTEAAVKEFQRRSGLKVDGRVGPETTRALARYGIRIGGPKGWR